VALTEKWAEINKNKGIGFYSMHPGEEIGGDVDVKQELHSLQDNGTHEMEALRNSITTSLMNASN